MDVGSVNYQLVEFYATEWFSDTVHNTKPHRVDAPRLNGHCVRSAGCIDDTLNGASAKQALDFLAAHNGTFNKPYSTVKAARAIYHAQDNSNVTPLGFSLPFSVELPFEQYVKLGRPETFSVTLDATSKNHCLVKF